MEVILGLAVFLFVVIAIRQTSKFLLKKIIRYENRLKEKERKKNNIYINYHKFKNQNDKSYQEYISWLDKNNIPGIPVDKIKFKEEEIAKAEYDNLLKDKKHR